jgi:predicted GIY-YIG superfamily endonuclease
MNEKKFYLYILKCNDGSYYTGHTDDLEKRMSEHQSKQYETYTAARLPVELVYSELFHTRDEAFCAEHKIKKWTRRKKEILISFFLRALLGSKTNKNENGFFLFYKPSIKILKKIINYFDGFTFKRIPNM